MSIKFDSDKAMEIADAAQLSIGESNHQVILLIVPTFTETINPSDVVLIIQIKADRVSELLKMMGEATHI